MFVGFIAVVVILLVIVGLMSSGATNGSGGVDQTKATKALSEISALAQSTGFYKTTTAGSDYTGLTTQGLIDAGIVASADIYTTVAADNVKVNGVQVVAATKMVKSKAVTGLYYGAVVNGTSVANFDLTVACDSDDIGATSGLGAALEKTYTKLAGNASVATGTVTTDGSAVITF
jgi:hypothetical protein